MPCVGANGIWIYQSWECCVLYSEICGSIDWNEPELSAGFRRNVSDTARAESMFAWSVGSAISNAPASSAFIVSIRVRRWSSVVVDSSNTCFA